MAEPIRYSAGRYQRLMRAAMVALGLLVAIFAYQYFDVLTDFAQSLTGGKLDHAQGRSLHLHY